MTSVLAPGLLVATPGMGCTFFDRTVVLLVEHGEEGALGFVVNRPTDTPVTSLIEGLESDDFAGEIPGEIWVGGPVAPDTGWVLFDPTSGDTDDVEAVELSERVAVSASRTVLSALTEGAGPSVYAVLLGYAGWGPGQLDDEIREGSWFWIDLEDDIVFDVPADDRWNAALSKLGIDPGRVVGSGAAEA